MGPMWWKALGVFLVLLVVGAASGYALGDHSTDLPGTIPSAMPVPAVSPSVPTPSVPSVTISPDPTNPPLAVGVPLVPKELRIGGANGFAVQAAVPDWSVDHTGNRWQYSGTPDALHTYGLRIDIIAGLHQSVTVAKAARLAALRESESQHHLQELDIQSDVGDTFTATYVSEGYRRLTMERFLTLGGTTAYVDVAVTGRMVDSDGLDDLLDRVSESMVAG
jgi:hypothetical protein